MKEELCKRLLNSTDLRSLAERVGKDKADDMIQEVALTICEKSNGYLRNIENFEYWAARIMFNFISKNGKSRYYQERNGLEIPEVEDYNPLIDEKSEQVHKALEDLHWYERKLFEEHVIKEQSLREISRQSKIPVTSLSYSVRATKEEIKSKVKW